jgi:amino acid efflux transporter
MAAGLARDGWLPRLLATGIENARTPRLGISSIAIAATVVLAVMDTTRVDLSQVMTLAAAMFIGVTVAGLAAGTRLLPTQRSRVVGGVAALFMGIVLAGCGWAALYPLVVLAMVMAYPQPRRSSCPPTPSLEAPATSGAVSSSGFSTTELTSP